MPSCVGRVHGLSLAPSPRSRRPRASAARRPRVASITSGTGDLGRRLGHDQRHRARPWRPACPRRGSCSSTVPGSGVRRTPARSRTPAARRRCSVALRVVARLARRRPAPRPSPCRATRRASPSSPCARRALRRRRLDHAAVRHRVGELAPLLGLEAGVAQRPRSPRRRSGPGRVGTGASPGPLDTDDRDRRSPRRPRSRPPGAGPRPGPRRPCRTGSARSSTSKPALLQRLSRRAWCACRRRSGTCCLIRREQQVRADRQRRERQHDERDHARSGASCAGPPPRARRPGRRAGSTPPAIARSSAAMNASASG